MVISLRYKAAQYIRQMDLFQKCFTGSFLLHIIIISIYYGPRLLAYAFNGSEAFNANKVTANNNVEVEFIEELPASITLSDHKPEDDPAPVEKEEWVEGTGEDKPDASNTDVNINKLSGTGTDSDGYMFADLADRPPIPIIDFDPNEYFPKEARSANIFRKTVIVRVQVNENGTVNSTRIISSASGYGFDGAAIKVINRIRFRPGKLHNKPVKMLVDLPLVFEFED